MLNAQQLITGMFPLKAPNGIHPSIYWQGKYIVKCHVLSFRKLLYKKPFKDKLNAITIIINSDMCKNNS
jgi:hypothetical protein